MTGGVVSAATVGAAVAEAQMDVVDRQTVYAEHLRLNAGKEGHSGQASPSRIQAVQQAKCSQAFGSGNVLLAKCSLVCRDPHP